MCLRVTHKHTLKQKYVSGKCIYFQLSDLKNATPIVPHFGLLMFFAHVFHSHFVSRTQVIHVPDNIRLAMEQGFRKIAINLTSILL